MQYFWGHIDRWLLYQGHFAYNYYNWDLHGIVAIIEVAAFNSNHYIHRFQCMLLKCQVLQIVLCLNQIAISNFKRIRIRLANSDTRGKKVAAVLCNLTQRRWDS